MKFFKNNSIVAQFKALNERISEWAYFLNLDKRFQRYLQFSVPKKGIFMDKSLRETSYLEWHQKQNFWWLFCSPLAIKPHNFVKNHPIFKNKGVFYAQFCHDLQEIFFMLLKSSNWGLELVLGQLGLKDLQSHKCRTLYPIFAKKVCLILCRIFSWIKCFT